MKKYLLFITFLISMIIASGCNGGEEQEVKEPEESQESVTEENTIDEDQAISLGETFIEQLSKGQYEEAEEHFDETMAKQLGAKQLEELWTTLENQAGAFIDKNVDSTQEVEGYRVVLINGLFEKADVTFTVTVDSQYQIAGFFVK